MNINEMDGSVNWLIGLIIYIKKKNPNWYVQKRVYVSVYTGEVFRRSDPQQANHVGSYMQPTYLKVIVAQDRAQVVFLISETKSTFDAQSKLSEPGENLYKLTICAEDHLDTKKCLALDSIDPKIYVISLSRPI